MQLYRKIKPRGLYFRTVYTKQLLSHLLPGHYNLKNLLSCFCLSYHRVLMFWFCIHSKHCNILWRIRNVSKNGDQIRHSFESSKTLKKNEWKQTYLFNKTWKRKKRDEEMNQNKVILCLLKLPFWSDYYRIIITGF